MARKYDIDSTLWDHVELGTLPIRARLLFVGVLSNADDEGRLKGDPRYLKGLVFRYDDKVTRAQIRDWCETGATTSSSRATSASTASASTPTCTSHPGASLAGDQSPDGLTDSTVPPVMAPAPGTKATATTWPRTSHSLRMQ